MVFVSAIHGSLVKIGVKIVAVQIHLAENPILIRQCSFSCKKLKTNIEMDKKVIIPPEVFKRQYFILFIDPIALG